MNVTCYVFIICFIQRNSLHSSYHGQPWLTMEQLVYVTDTFRFCNWYIKNSICNLWMCFTE